MSQNVAELFDLQNDVLFREAQAINEGFRKLRCSPIFMIGTCTTRPACRHCGWENMRKVHPNFYRKRTREEIVQRTRVLIEAGIDRAFMPSGWMGYEVPDYFYENLAAVKENSAMEVYGLFGAVKKTCLEKLKSAGMDGYFCGLESPNEQVYSKFRPGGDSLGDRKAALTAAREIGLKIWSGFILGLGETQPDIIDGLEFLSYLEVDSVTIWPFIPYPYTEMWRENLVNPLQWARTIAISRIFLDTANIFVYADGLYGDFGRITGANGNQVYISDKL